MDIEKIEEILDFHIQKMCEESSSDEILKITCGFVAGIIGVETYSNDSEKRLAYTKMLDVLNCIVYDIEIASSELYADTLPFIKNQIIKGSKESLIMIAFEIISLIVEATCSKELNRPSMEIIPKVITKSCMWHSIWSGSDPRQSMDDYISEYMERLNLVLQ
jgi:hypothetical protein